MDDIGAVIDVIVALRGANRIQFRTAAGRIGISLLRTFVARMRTRYVGGGVWQREGFTHFHLPRRLAGAGCAACMSSSPPTHAVFFSDPS